MTALIDILKVIHIVNAILMAWPFYALVAVNERGRLGPPLGDRVDTYLENIVKNRTIPCFVFQATALVTGLALVLLNGLGIDVLVTSPMLGLKFWLLLLIAALLSYVHFSLQPRLTLCLHRLATLYRLILRLALTLCECAVNAWHPSACSWY